MYTSAERLRGLRQIKDGPVSFETKTSNSGIQHEGKVGEQCRSLHVVRIDSRLERLNDPVVEKVEIVCRNRVEHLLLATKSKSSCAGKSGTEGHVHTLMMRQLWARSHKTHVALENVVKLRQLIQFVSAQYGPDRCYAPVSMNSYCWSMLLRRSYFHRAEFKDGE